MRILQLNTEPGWRGGERQTFFTTQGLMKAGFKTVLVAQTGKPLAQNAKAAGMDVRELKMRGSVDLVAAFKLSQIISKDKIDIVHAQTSHAASLVLLSRLFNRKAKLVVSRRVDFKIKSALKYNKFDAVVPISDAIKDILIEAGVEESKIELIPSGIDTEIKESESWKDFRGKYVDKDETLIGSIAHLTDHKGFKYLIEAMPVVLEKCPKCKLIIIGDGELKEDLAERITFLGLENKVVLAGFIPDAVSAIPAFDIYVQPSVLEGLCSTLMDVLLRKVPVIASQTGGIPEVLNHGEYGKLVPPGDSKSLARAILEFASNPRKVISYTETSDQWINATFSKEKMVEKTIELYRKLLKP